MDHVKPNQLIMEKAGLCGGLIKTPVLFLLFFLVFGLTQSSAQYGPLYWDLRQFDSLPAYRNALNAFNAQDNGRAYFLLDSIADACLLRGEKRKSYQARNDQATMLYIRGDYTTSYQLFSENLNTMSQEGDSLHYEFAIALRIMSYLSNYYKEAVYPRKYYTDRQFAILHQMSDSSEMMVDCTADKAYVALAQGDKHQAIDLFAAARLGAIQLHMDEPLLRIEHTLVNQLADEQPELAVDIFENQYLTAGRAYLKDSIALVILAYTVAEKSALLGQYQKAIDYYAITDQLLKATGYQQPKLINALPLETAIAYAQIGQREKFQSYIRETLEKTSQDGDRKIYDAEYVHLAIAESFLLFDADSTLHHLALATEAASPTDTLTMAKIGYLQAKAYFLLKQADSAASAIDKATHQLLAVLTSIPAQFTQAETEGLGRDFQMIAAEIYHQRAQYDQSAVVPAKNAIRAAIQNLNQLALLLSNEKDQLSLSTDYRKLALWAFDLADQQDVNAVASAWSLLADSKTFQLKRAMQKSRQEAQLLAENTTWDNRLRAEKRVFTLKNDIENASFRKEDSLMMALRRELKQKQIELLLANFQLEESVKTPVEFIFEPTQITDIKKMMQEDECLIDYYLTNDKLLAFAITQNDLRFFVLDSASALATQKKAFLRAIKTAGNYVPSATALSEQLLKPFADLLAGCKHIIFLPDDWLFQIPFEALTWPGTHDMLVQHAAVSYHYSAYLWQQSTTDKLSKNPSLLALAPVFEQPALLAQQDSPYRAIAAGFQDDFNGYSLQVAPLPFTKTEVNNLEDVFSERGRKVQVLIGNDANKGQFFTQSNPYEIIHFATHGFANFRTNQPAGLLMAASESDREKGINSDFLHLGELYNTQTTAALVVLSACNSGAGPMAEAEGVMAIPRAFFYAGIPNVVASLWGVNDRTTATLMESFYGYLLQGDSFAASLQQAKTDAIRQQMLPLDWAGFVLIGR